MTGGLLCLAVTGANENAPRADTLACLEIVPAIAYHERLIEREVQVRCRALQQTWLRLPAVARSAIRLDDGLRMMRTIVEAVHAGAPGRQTPGNVAVCLPNEGLLENPAGNASLVGHDDDRKPSAI